MKRKESLLACLKSELIQRSDFFDKGAELDTLYFGGGTPSLLKSEELAELIECVRENYSLNTALEICLEANPDDLKMPYLKELKALGVNRLSIGVQSLLDRDLQWMNRSHSAQEAMDAVENASQLGFKDLSVDLIYGLAKLTLTEWKRQVDQVLQWPINHLSAYSLTLEQKTVYAKQVAAGLSKPPPDELAIAHYEVLQAQIQHHGWEQYEISNYCKTGNYSKHNSSYWIAEPYLGIGPSAHSYKGQQRSWNVRSNAAYIQQLETGSYSAEYEMLSIADLVNERLMTGLRTKWGVDLQALKTKLGCKLMDAKSEEINSFIAEGHLSLDREVLRLTDSGKLLADYISASLFVDHSSQISS